MKTNKLVRGAVVAAIYAILTLTLPAYGALQFRLSEIMTLLAYFDPFYVVPLTIGCAIANIASPFGIVDVIFGSLASFLALTAMSKTKNIFLASIWPAFFSFIIGLEIMFLSTEPVNFFLITGQIMLSEFVVVTIIGIPVIKYVMRNEYVERLVTEF
ncbi:QueT transporter family protein [Tissierella sp. Yu-01]|uniref:QueT transporter family protein n=1 Tax=Tissierella sp. Yu-01 TaxID=3035694 RepID=UPI00240E4BBB|nr:QueT transporter family protein [Tissierella sp. Yu-01]WFA08448.1 QueT transporter family protein [Tissierella sp. Yu-01]